MSTKNPDRSTLIEDRRHFVTRCVAILSVIGIFALVGLFINFASRERKSEPELLFWIENASITSPNIRVTIDESVIFDGEARPATIMPAIIFSKYLGLPSGQHTIRFEDPSRGITEVKTFSTPETRTIFVYMEEHVLSHQHIDILDELLYPS